MEHKIIRKEWVEWLIHIVLAVAITLLIVNFIGQFTVVKGNSMLPTLKNNSVLVIEKLFRFSGSLHQGDIVVLRVPELMEGNRTYAVKRIIGTEGQRVTIQDGKIYVDETELDEPYAGGGNTFAPSMFNDIIIPQGYIYVVGDNRLPGASRDSRTFGPVSESRVAGRVVFRLFPFSELGIVN